MLASRFPVKKGSTGRKTRRERQLGQAASHTVWGLSRARKPKSREPTDAYGAVLLGLEKVSGRGISRQKG